MRKKRQNQGGNPQISGRTFPGSALALMVLVFVAWAPKIAFSQSDSPSFDLYFVYFKDKPQTTFAPETYFSPKAIERRVLHDLPGHDWYDLPLNAGYVQTAASLADSLRYQLRWFNAITVRATSEQISRIEALPFVRQVESFDTTWTPELAEVPTKDETNAIKKDSEEKLDLLASHQRKQLNLDTLLAHGLTGEGVRIAVFDAGFKGANKHTSLEHLFEHKQIIGIKDFFSNRKHVYYHSGHGTSVLSCIGGKYKGNPLGAAPDAEFLLARTESLFGEKIKEEDHWLAAMEWADQNGADIINSSLGYTKRRYDYADMDGRTTRVTRAAGIATRKGILVVNSQGNEGNEKFHYVGAPADADSVLSVGGTYPMVKMHIKFSSFGPNSRKVLKPNVSAPGAAVGARPNGSFKAVYGTSFSSPIVAGFAAAVKQLYPEKTNMELFALLQEISHCYPYFDYAHGYGVPDASNLFHPRDTISPTFKLNHFGDTILVRFDTVVVNADTLKRKNGKPFYVHFEDAETGALSKYNYYLIRPRTLAFMINMDRKKKGVMRIWFEGYLYEEEFE